MSACAILQLMVNAARLLWWDMEGGGSNCNGWWRSGKKEMEVVGPLQLARVCIRGGRGDALVRERKLK